MKTRNTRILAPMLRAAPALTAAGVLFSGGLGRAQPTISSIYPDGSVQFQWTNKLTFVTGGTAAVTNISVTLDGKPMNGTPVIRIYTSAAGLTINGNNVSAPVQSNFVYTATIVATDATGASTTNTASFDTIRPTYTWEAEDWDYNSGQFFDNPQLNAYAGKAGVAETDAHADYTGSVGTAYRPAGPANLGNLGNEVNGDTPRTQYLSSGQSDYDAGWSDAGNWTNYTRHYPAGKWNVFMRGSNPNASGTTSAYLSLGGPFGASLGQFGVPNTGSWQVYTWVPLTDSAGNLVEWESDGTAQILTVYTSGGNYNANFYLLLPVPAPLTQDATISDISPDGTHQFQPTNLFSFTINSTLGVQPANIIVQLGGTNLEGKVTSAVLQAGSGLHISGPATALVVTFPLATNTVYKAALQVTDANNFIVSATVGFDTIVPSYTWEAEDYDYEGGKFFDNPQTNAYATLQATLGVDGYNPNNGSQAYRPVVTTGADGDLGTENNGDTPRVQYQDPSNPQTDYDVGWTSAGSRLWGNYTRHYPAGKWNIYMRAAGNGGSSLTAPSAWLYQGGTNGALLGRFVVRNVSNWQIYTWTPLTDVAGNLIEWDTDGSQQTLTMQVAGGNYNVNFFMLVPVDPSYKPLPFVNPISPDGNAQMFSYTNVLSFTANSVPGITANNVVVTLNGLPATHLTTSGSPHALNVSVPLATNRVYSLMIKLTDANGSSTYSSTIGTFSPNSYTFECEDWDHDSGQFIDNPPVDAYATLSGVDLVDGHSTSTGSQSYRPAPGGFCTENCGDQKRPQYANTNDYDIAYTTAGFWANYTRTYPAGVYNIYVRASCPSTSGQQADAGRLLWVTSGVGTSTQTTAPIGTFNVPATGGWQNYTWAPLVDTHGNPVQVTNTGAKATFQFYEDNGNFNANFFMLVPADTARPTLSQVYPDGSTLFQPTNTFSFVASSSAGIDPNSIVVTVNGVVATNLVFGGSPTNMTVLLAGLRPNTAYTVTVTLTSLNNDSTSATYNFSTFSSQYYTFEAEDWDYNGGHYIDNPQIDAYVGLAGITNVDAYNTQGGGTSYRTNDLGNLGNEVNSDIVRAQYASAATNDYDIGWTAKGNWANYTRTYPTGTYNIYLRGSSPNGVKAAASLSWVTSGLGTTNQTTSELGIFNIPLTGGYQIFGWTLLVDTNGSLVYVTTTGAASTLRLSQLAGGWNANFFMLVPATAPPTLSVSHSGSNVAISWTPVVGQLYQSPALAGPTVNWQAIPGATNGSVSVPATQGAQFFRVGSP